MSTINVNIIADASGGVLAPISSVMRNRIINGAMVIDQRNAGASVTPTDNAYTIDRWQSRLSQASKYSVQQSSTAPAGFTNSLLVTSLSAYAVGASEFFQVRQTIEGFNTADLNWGTANAKTVTLSFWVRSSLTGTFGGVLSNSGGTRNYVFSYSINTANTFEQKTITIAGDTSGTWLTNNGGGFTLAWTLGAGASVSTTAGVWGGFLSRGVTGGTSVVGTNGATFYITGVQLEVGSSATGFEYRQYQQELALCQRYYQIIGDGSQDCVGYATYASAASQSMYITIPYLTMRATPTATVATFAVANCGQPIMLAGTSALIFSLVSTAAARIAARSDANARPIQLSAEL